MKVTRRRAQGQGGGRIRTKLNFLSLITEGNESQNIRLFDGDVVSVGRSKVVMREQLRQAGQTNLSPQYINVFVNGRVKNPGGVTIPNGSALNQAITLAGGLTTHKAEFIRFKRWRNRPTHIPTQPTRRRRCSQQPYTRLVSDHVRESL